MATRVCKHCKKRDDINNFIAIKKDENKNKAYYHVKCYEEYNLQREQIEIDNKEKDNLVKTVCEIYNIAISSIPTDYFVSLSNLRNGDALYGKKSKSKEGYSYKVIEYTYKKYGNYLKGLKNTKNFKSIRSELKYGLAIIADKIYYINKQYQNYIKDKEINIKKELKQNYVNNYDKNKTKNDSDISSFLN